MRISGIISRQRSMKWRNCRLSTKTPDHQLGWAVLTASRLLDTPKHNFHSMKRKFSQPYMLQNIKGMWYKWPVYSSPCGKIEFCDFRIRAPCYFVIQFQALILWFENIFNNFFLPFTKNWDPFFVFGVCFSICDNKFNMHVNIELKILF